MKIDKSTLIRTIILFFSVLNIVLEKFGISAIPIEDELVNEVISVGLLLYGVISSWWKNNSFTREARQADEYLKELKEEK